MNTNAGFPSTNGGNLFQDALPPAQGERFEPLLQHRNLVIERIISSAAIAETEFVQEQDEWVLLVQGTAVLDINGATKSLKAGDYVFLPAKTPHTVKQVSAGALWLAVHLHPE
jgi:cupin 2 domain-containing protein